MKKSVIFFAMLSAATAFVSCDQNSVINARKEAAMDSIHVSVDSTDFPVPTDSGTVVDTSSNIPTDTVGTHDIIVPLTGDEFMVTPSIIDSASVSGLMFSITGSKSYQCQNSYLYFNGFYQEPDSKVSKMRLLRVIQPGVRYCQEGEKKMSVSTLIYPVSEGYSYFEIELNETIYKGTIMKTGNTYTMIWPYTQGIKFSKLTVMK